MSERSELQFALRQKIMGLQNDRMSEHGKTVKSTKQDTYIEEQKELENQRLQKELLKKEKERKRQKEKKKRQKEKKKNLE